MAVLLKHHDLGHVVASMVEHGLSETPGGAHHKHHIHADVTHKHHALPRSIAEICKFVSAAKISLIKVCPKYVDRFMLPAV